MNFPPTKRLRGLNHDVETVTAFDDPFGDDDDFTQDDLDEIDVIASQAITSATASGLGSKPGIRPTELACGSTRLPSAAQSKQSRAATNHSRENTFGFSSSNRGNAGIPSRELLSKFRSVIIHLSQCLGSYISFCLSFL